MFWSYSNNTQGLNRSVIKCLIAENFKPWKIYRRVCDMFREACFSQKMFPNELNMGLPLYDWVKKTLHRMETHWLSDKEKVPGAITSKGHADCLLGHERTHHNWFSWKRRKYKQCFQLFIYWMIHVCLYISKPCMFHSFRYVSSF